MQNVYLSLEQTEAIAKLGFKPDYVTEPEETDVYAYKDEIWVLGGCFFNPKHKGFFAPDYVHKEGKRLTTADDLIEWLGNRLTYEIAKEKDSPWKGFLFAVDGKHFEVEGQTLLEVLYNLVVKALELQPNLNQYDVPPSYELIEVK